MQMVSMLVRSGADVDIAPYDDDDMSPMEMAEDTKCEGMLQLLRLAPSWIGPPDVDAQVQCGRQGGVPHRRGSQGWVTGTIVGTGSETGVAKGKYAPYDVKLDDSEDWSSPRRTMTTASGSSARDVD